MIRNQSDPHEAAGPAAGAPRPTLRQQAEAKSGTNTAQTPARLSPEESGQLLHALRVHQIELEMQNEELRRTQVELEKARARYFDLYNLAPVGYVTLDDQGLILEANIMAATLLGVARNALVRQPLMRFILPEDQGVYHQLCQHLVETGAQHVAELRLRRADAIPLWLQLEMTTAQDANGAPVHRAVMSDITARKQTEEELHRASAALESTDRELRQSLAREQQLARTDGLTGLYNRRQFFELATREFSAAVRYSHPLTVLMFDADGFKQVNDLLGHTAGDQMLARIAQTAAAHTRAVDILARYGGDEFVILLPQTNAQQALPVAEHIRESVATLHQEIDQGLVGVTLSIGIAELWLAPADQSVECIVRRADEALYAAKALGRNCTVIFSAETERSEP